MIWVAMAMLMLSQAINKARSATMKEESAINKLCPSGQHAAAVSFSINNLSSPLCNYC
jgi:hypothetical protein